MANKIYYSKTTRTGGGATALDSIDGNSLVDGDFGYVTISGISLEVYKLKAGSASPPGSFPPATNPGTKRWELLSVLPGFASAAEILTGTEPAKAIPPDQLKAAGFIARVNKTEANSPYTVTAANLTGLSVFTNTGAGAQTIFQLPAGVDGYTFKGIVTVAQYMQFLCNGTETIRFQGTQSAAGGYVRSNVIGNTIQGEWSGTEWVITGIGGAWTYDL